MPVSLDNPWRGVGLDPDGLMPVADASGVAALLGLCPAHQETPLHDAPGLARLSGVAAVWVKDERQRMGLGSFKALGATHAIARLAAARAGHDPHALRHALAGQTFVAASAGNHGLSVAAGARLFGAAAVIFVLVSWWSARNIITPEGEQASALFGDFSIGAGAYAGVVAVIVLVGALTALTTRLTVLKALRDIDERRADPSRLD